ncbi:MAG: trypsin-like peptidase domain-containing protein [Patescibacteria group bacterium]
MNTEKRVIKTIKNVMPAVVTIVIKKSLEEVKKDLKAEQASTKNMLDKIDVFSIPKDKIDSHGMVQIDGGSGFIVDKKGIVLTNKHVISDLGAEYTVIMNNNEEYKATLLARDPVDDVAILKIESPKKLPTLEFGNSQVVQIGQTVLAFGNALGIFQNTVSMGIISGLSRSILAHPDPKAPAQEMRGLIQTDAAINPGNSGGPLTDIYGRVIGINAAIVSDAENISLAIPINSAIRDLEDIKKYGKIRRPLLGLHYLILGNDLAEKLRLPVSYGAIVMREHPMEKAIIPESPAEDAGLKENDIILEWNGEKITTEKTILDFLETQNVGDSVKLKVFRDEKEINLTLILGERK